MGRCASKPQQVGMGSSGHNKNGGVWRKKQNRNALPEKSVAEKIREQMEGLEKRKLALEHEVKRCLVEAGEARQKGNDMEAERKMAEKRMKKKQLDTLHNQLMNLTKMKVSAESMENTVQAGDIFRNVQPEIAQLNRRLNNVDDADNVMTSIQDMIDHHQEVADRFGEPMGDAYDPSELLNELDAELGWTNGRVPSPPGVATGMGMAVAETRRTQRAQAEKEGLNELEARLDGQQMVGL